jgi:hypothetical protein
MVKIGLMAGSVPEITLTLIPAELWRFDSDHAEIAMKEMVNPLLELTKDRV